MDGEDGDTLLGIPGPRGADGTAGALANIGRPLPSGGATLTAPGVSFSHPTAIVVSNLLAQAQNDVFMPYWVVGGDLEVTDLYSFIVTEDTSGGSDAFRIGLYEADEDWQPTNLLYDSGDISLLTAGIKIATPSTPLILTAAQGRYLGVINSTSSTAVWRALSGQVAGVQYIDQAWGTSPFGRNWRVARSYAAFTDPGPAWDTFTAEAVVFNWYTILLNVTNSNP
jgi:hypothetical protein